MTSEIIVNENGLAMEKADLFGARVSVMLMRGNWEGAKAVVDTAMAEAKADRKVNTLDLHLGDTEIAKECAALLEKYLDVHFVWQLDGMTVEQLRALPGFGLARAKEVVAFYRRARRQAR